MATFTNAPAGPGFQLPQVGHILCCICGTSIVPNEAAMCMTCLKLQYHSEIPKSYELELTQCSKCGKWHHRQSQWLPYDMETPELLSFCIKKIPFFHNNANNSIKITDSNWIWTEPHSKRLKLYINYEHKLEDYQSLAISNQIQAEYVIKNKQCMTCIYENNDHTWNAMIQLRSFTSSSSISSMISANTLSTSVMNSHTVSKIFYQIETLLIQSKMYQIISDIETLSMSSNKSSGSGQSQQKSHANAISNGLNLFFRQKNQAEKVMSFLQEYFPFIIKKSKKIISANQQSSTSRSEHIILMELLPVNRNDLLLIPKQVHGKNELMIINKLSSIIHCLNPLTLATYDINITKYCQYPFQTILNEKYLVPFVVLDIIPIDFEGVSSVGGSVAGGNTTQGKKHNRKNKKANKHDDWPSKTLPPPVSSSVPPPPPVTASPGKKSPSLDYDNRSVKSISGKWQLAEAVVMRESDLGENDTSYTVRTHLGNILQAGDTVLGYDLLHAVLGCQQEHSLNSLRAQDVPEILLVKKIFPEK
jgi:nonsense-mediated mRNA decay protein 3